MRNSSRSIARLAASAVVVSAFALTLSGCGGMAENRTVDSVHKPVVERTNYTLDVAAGPSGLQYGEQQRLTDWFEAMSVRYGDSIYIDDPQMSSATRSSIEAIAGRYGLLLSSSAPQTAGDVPPGSVRVVVTRSVAHVPGCPDWSSNSDFNPNNATSSNFGCGVNSNLAAMVANPEHLVKGDAGTGETVIMSSNKAIETYRNMEPTGNQGLAKTSTTKEEK